MSFLDNFGVCSSEIGDYIGTESCIDLMSSLDEVKSAPGPGGRVRLTRSESKPKKEFPPPIPMLARTENLSPHMPWTLKRYYSGDGRLIIKEVRVPHHDYFKVNRSGGRLTLDLVPMDDEFFPLGLGIDDDDEVNDPDAAAEEAVAVVEGEDLEEEDHQIIMNPTVVEEDPIQIPIPIPSVEEEFANLHVAGGGCWSYGGGNETAACLLKVNVA
ncbi:uncharacterized protein LOC124910041 [Impatiens glandulifera]|uniref:uncharacterized protein LOC124910041 n=1 Tax=Impatiens glandulifera TaxID=253017 RepID=UPI001FB12DB7|nr:uncharacterized protein LOC124910041 [Impatiens glandulifera]